jgi:transcriptional regulator with XRE-family HTH domain
MGLFDNSEQLHLRQAQGRVHMIIGKRPALRQLASQMKWPASVYSLAPPVLRSGPVGSSPRWSYRPPMLDADEAPKDSLLAAVGMRIKNLRELKRMTPKDFAQAAGFSLSYLWRLESGQQNLNLRSISRIAIALGEPMTALLDGIEPDPATVEVRPYTQRARTGPKMKDAKAAKNHVQGST